MGRGYGSLVGEAYGLVPYMLSRCHLLQVQVGHLHIIMNEYESHWGHTNRWNWVWVCLKDSQNSVTPILDPYPLLSFSISFPPLLDGQILE